MNQTNKFPGCETRIKDALQCAIIEWLKLNRSFLPVEDADIDAVALKMAEAGLTVLTMIQPVSADATKTVENVLRSSIAFHCGEGFDKSLEVHVYPPGHVADYVVIDHGAKVYCGGFAGALKTYEAITARKLKGVGTPASDAALEDTAQFLTAHSTAIRTDLAAYNAYVDITLGRGEDPMEYDEWRSEI